MKVNIRVQFSLQFLLKTDLKCNQKKHIRKNKRRKLPADLLVLQFDKKDKLIIGICHFFHKYFPFHGYIIFLFNVQFQPIKKCFLQTKFSYDLDFSGSNADLFYAKTVDFTASDYLFFGILAALLC